MKNQSLSKILTAFVLLFSLQAHAKLYKYTELQLKDYEEMSDLVNAKVNKALQLFDKDIDNDADLSSTTDAADEENDRVVIEELREALRIILSRPNRDNMVAKLIPGVRRELKNFNAYDDTLKSVAMESLSGVNSKKVTLVYRSTYLFMLENVMEEVQPGLLENKTYRSIYERIRDAKLDVPKDILAERRKRMIKKFDPSEVAENVLEKVDKQLKERAKREEEAKKKKAKEKKKS